MLKLFLFLISVKTCFCICPNSTIASFSNPSNCYLFVSDKFAFITAEGFCRGQGGHLTSIANAFDNMFLSQEAALAFHDSTETDFWIGGTNELIPGNWSWIDGTPLNYADWMKGQPENVSTSNCAASSFTNSLWTAEDCFKNKSFVCLIPYMTVTTTTTISTTTKKVLSCENGWKYYEMTGFCYKAFTNINATWADAENYCFKNYNSHLVSIHSQTESIFVADLARGLLSRGGYLPCFNHQCWIGLYTVTDNAAWIWTDDSLVDYLGWSPGEPNGATVENCVHLLLSNCGGDVSNYWNNVPCSYNIENFVCKKSRS